MSTLDAAVFAFIRTRAQPRRLLSGAGTPALSRQLPFATAFAAAGAGAAWRWPWIGDGSYSYYWARSLGPQYRRAVTADRAWKRQVPLREATAPLLSTSIPGVSLRGDRFVFPSSTGVLLQAEVSGSLDAAGLLGLAERLAHERVIVTPGSTQPKALRAVLDELLDGIEQQVLGDVDPDAAGEPATTTIATVTASTGWPSTAISQGDPVHRLLEGVCLMSPAPLNGHVSDLAAGTVSEAHSNPDTVRYCVGDGRAIWLPEFAAAHDSRRMYCYHRNLSMATLHASALLDAVRLAEAQPGGNFSEDVRAVLRQVVTVLSLFYAKVTDMYTSAMIRKQLIDSGLIAAISQLRIRLGVGAALS
jgi:hypothetical protein